MANYPVENAKITYFSWSDITPTGGIEFSVSADATDGFGEINLSDKSALALSEYIASEIKLGKHITLRVVTDD